MQCIERPETSQGNSGSGEIYQHADREWIVRQEGVWDYIGITSVRVRETPECRDDKDMRTYKIR